MATLAQVKEHLASLRKRGKRNYGDGTILVKKGRRALYGRIWVNGAPNDITLSIEPAQYSKASQAVNAALEELRRIKYNDTERAKHITSISSEPLTIDGILDAYFGELDRRLRTGQKIEQKSIDDARGFVDKHVRPHIGSWVAEDVTKNQIEELRDTIAKTPKERGGGKRSLSGIQAPLKQLRAAYRYAMYECDPPLINRMPKIEILAETHLGRDGYFPEEDIPTILPFFDRSTRVAIAVALDSGLRSIKELLFRRWEDINWKASTIFVLGDSAKNDEGRNVPVRPETMQMLREAKKLRDACFPSCPWVFFWQERRGRGDAGQRMAGVYQQFKDAMNRAAKELKRPELEKRVPHDCRRSFVTNMAVDRALTDTEIQALSGHKDPSVFKRYKVPSRQAAAIAVNIYKQKAGEAPNLSPIRKASVS